MVFKKHLQVSSQIFQMIQKTLDEVETFKFDTGIESVSNLNLKLDDDLLFTSELRLFSAFDQLRCMGC